MSIVDTTSSGAKPDLMIRARPRPVRRFSRKALILGGGSLSAILFAALAFALQPPSYGTTKSTELYNVAHKPVAEGLEQLPKSYAELTPKLGPPLPGDLGAAYLSKGYETGKPDQNPFRFDPNETLETAPKPAIVLPRTYTPKRAKVEPQPAPAKDTQAEIRHANLFFSLGSKTQNSQIGVSGNSLQGYAPYGASNANFAALPDFTDALSEFAGNGQSAKHGFLAQTSNDIYNSHQLQSPRSPYQVMAGTLIPASLVTGLNSDLPGQVIAQVSENVYDTVSGEHLLIPQGARLIGKYDSAISYGQSRALVVWSRLIFPNGNSIQLDNLAAVDGQGHAGLKDKVDRHTWGVVKGAALSSLLGVGAELATDRDDRIVRALQSSGQETLNQAGQRIVDKSLNIQPTITVRAGWRFSVLVSRDLILKPYTNN